MTEVQKMRGEKIYECDFNITGMTDYGVTLDALLSGIEKVPPQGARIDVAFEGDIKGRITGKVRSGVDTCSCEPMDALTSTAGPQSKLKTVIASRCALRALQRRERMNRCWTSSPTCVSPPQLRNMIGSTRGRFGVSPP
jgi:hypothetical protein